MVTKKDRITLYIPESIKKQLIDLAAKDRRSLSVFIEVLILEALASRGIILQSEENEEE